jgi:hypothetical protein
MRIGKMKASEFLVDKYKKQNLDILIAWLLKQKRYLASQKKLKRDARHDYMIDIDSVNYEIRKTEKDILSLEAAIESKQMKMF